MGEGKRERQRRERASDAQAEREGESRRKRNKHSTDRESQRHKDFERRSWRKACQRGAVIEIDGHRCITHRQGLSRERILRSAELS